MRDEKIIYLSSNLLALIGILITLECISLFFNLMEYRYIQRILLYDYDYSADRLFITLQNSLISILYLIFRILSFAYFIRWMYHAHKNLEEKQIYYLNYRSGSSVWSWFVPLLNLILPFQIVREIYETTINLTGKEDRSSSLVTWWWTLSLVSILAGFFEPGVLKGINSADLMEYFRNPFPFFIPPLAVLVSLALGFIMVSRIRQALKSL